MAANNRNSYVYGNTAPNLDIKSALEEKSENIKLVELESENIRRKKTHMNFMYVLFLVAALTVTGYALVSYLKLQSEITESVENISTYESRLNKLTLANDDKYSKMVEAVDLDEIRRVAIEELGMVYADDDQIISYTRENSDYVRQVNDLD